MSTPEHETKHGWIFQATEAWLIDHDIPADEAAIARRDVRAALGYPVDPQIAPGTVGMATVRGQQGVTVMRVEVGQPYQEPGIETLWRSAQGVPGGSSVFYNHDDDEVTGFVPDADTAALRAEVERLLRESNGYRADAQTHFNDARRLTAALAAEQRARSAVHVESTQRLTDLRHQTARADAAEARLARLTPEALEGAVLGVAEKYHRDWIKPGGAQKIAAAVLALVAADEQAGVSPEVSPTLARAGEQETRGEVACTCKVVNGGGCLGGCTDERVIDPACPVHGVSVPGVGGAA